jgi:ABC-type bacteriocin/lantibiotic exporter with double-glycine peptidase domain
MSLLIVLSILLSLAFPLLSPAQVVKAEPPLFSPRCVIENVPHIWQIGGQCGPASMAMVLNYWGVEIGQNALALSMGTVKGTAPRMMSYYPKTMRFSVENYSGSLEHIAQNISKGRPVIVMQWLNYRDKQEGSVGHYRVVTGYDWEKKLMFMNDPNRKGHSRLDFTTFLDLWDMSLHPYGSGNWMLVTYRPQRNP